MCTNHTHTTFISLTLLTPLARQRSATVEGDETGDDADDKCQRL